VKTLRDEELVERSRAGQELAFRELVQRHARPLFAVAHRLVQDETAAEDVVQEALLRAWRGLARFDGRSAVGTWLHRIAVNCALDHLRRGQRLGDEVAVEEPAGSVGEGERAVAVALPSGEPDPERRTLSGEIAAVVERTLPSLSLLERTAFVLRHFEGRSTEEIAQALGVDVQAGKHAVFRAVQKLRLALTPLLGRGDAGGPGAAQGRRGPLAASLQRDGRGGRPIAVDSVAPAPPTSASGATVSFGPARPPRPALFERRAGDRLGGPVGLPIAEGR
jgi:RNA polymerase sigma-70 factor (ECF subfamily)